MFRLTATAQTAAQAAPAREAGAAMQEMMVILDALRTACRTEGA